jgi:hypothetical protein
MKWLSILFIWMKYFHITKNNLIYKNRNIVKYSVFFYLLRFFYPIWIIIGIFTFVPIYWILFLLELVKYFIYPFFNIKVYRWYELIESIISIILFIILLF